MDVGGGNAFLKLPGSFRKSRKLPGSFRKLRKLPGISYHPPSSALDCRPWAVLLAMRKGCEGGVF